MDELLKKAIDLFNAGYYFEAHDVFEEIWMYDREESKKFYQGLVQLSTGCYHFTMKNFKGTESQLSKGIQKLERYQPIYKEMNVTQLLAQFELFLKKIKRLESSKLSQTNLIDQIPKLKFGVS